MSEVWNQILDHIHVRQWRYLHIAFAIFDRGCAGKAVLAINIHRTRPANPFAAGPAERQRAILFTFDFDQRIKNHRTTFVEINFERIKMRVFATIRIIAIDFEGFDMIGTGFRFVDRAFFDFTILGQREFSHVASFAS